MLHRSQASTLAGELIDGHVGMPSNSGRQQRIEYAERATHAGGTQGNDVEAATGVEPVMEVLQS